jgi:hypothetical protein
MIEILKETEGDLLALRFADAITQDDYEKIKPLLEEKVEHHEKIKLYAEIDNFSDVGLGAIWEDLKLDVKYFNNFNKIAVVGPKDWKEDLVKAARQLVPAEVKYFEAKEVNAAKGWIS